MATIKLNINGEIVEVEKDLVSQGVEAGEVKIESDKLIVKSEDNIIYTKDEHETYTTNLKNQEYKNGKVAGEEMAFKAIKNASGYDIEGYKDAETLFTGIKAKVIEDTGKEPSKKIQDLESDKAALQTNYQTLENDFNTFKTGVTEKETRTKKDTTLSSFIPTEGLKVDSDITLMALKSKAGVDIDFDENGKSFITVNGEMVKDTKTLQPIEPKGFIESKLKGLDLIKGAEGGGGGGDDTGDAKAGSYDALVIEMKSKDIEEGTQAFAIELNKRIKDKTVVM